MISLQFTREDQNANVQAVNQEQSAVPGPTVEKKNTEAQAESQAGGASPSKQTQQPTVLKVWFDLKLGYKLRIKPCFVNLTVES